MTSRIISFFFLPFKVRIHAQKLDSKPKADKKRKVSSSSEENEGSDDGSDSDRSPSKKAKK
jgi:hypothetical protein